MADNKSKSEEHLIHYHYQNQQKFESDLFKAADKLRKNIDAAEYKHIVLGLIFLNYVFHSFQSVYTMIAAKNGKYQFADAEDPDEYISRNLFWLPKKARWDYLRKVSRDSELGRYLDTAMQEIEKSNVALKGILPKLYSRRNISSSTLSGLMDLIENAPIKEVARSSKDLLGRVYEYFLGRFALAEGQKGGQFYTPKSIVKLLVEMVQPFKGRIYDPCCGSGGMFVMSEKFIESHKGNHTNISVFGQESNQTTYRLCCMNLAMHGIDSSQVIWNNDGSFLRDAHLGKEMDYILANPPFNDSDWGGDKLQDDARWAYGIPPVGNANFAWVQHFISHLKVGGVAGFVLANGSLSSSVAGGNQIRKGIVEDGLVDCIVNLPTKLFLNTQIPACLWFISRKPDNNKRDEVLFIDASSLGRLSSRRLRTFSDEDINRIVTAYISWKNGKRKNIPGFCQSMTLSELRKNNYVLSPPRYISPIKTGFRVDNKRILSDLRISLSQQLKEEANLNQKLKDSINYIGEVNN